MRHIVPHSARSINPLFAQIAHCFPMEARHPPCLYLSYSRKNAKRYTWGYQTDAMNCFLPEVVRLCVATAPSPSQSTPMPCEADSDAALSASRDHESRRRGGPPLAACGHGNAPPRASTAGAVPCPCDAPHRRRFRRTRKPASRDTKPACGRSRKASLRRCRDNRVPAGERASRSF